MKVNPPPPCITTSTTTTTTTTTTPAPEVVGEIDVNINDVMYGDLVFDEIHGWIRQPITSGGITKPATGVDTGFVSDLAADYLDYEYDESLSALLPMGEQYDFDLSDYLYNPFPMVEEKLIQSGEIEIASGPSRGISGISGSTSISSGSLRGPGKNNILDDPDLDSIMKDIERLQAGHGADEIFTPPPTKSTRSTKYIPPIPTSPRKLITTQRVVVTAATPPPRTKYQPPVKNYFVTEGTVKIQFSSF